MPSLEKYTTNSWKAHINGTSNIDSHPKGDPGIQHILPALQADSRFLY